jgi:transposase
MAMGRRKTQRQGELFISHQKLPKSQGHPFYERLNQILSEEGFDAFAEGQCAPFYAEGDGAAERGAGRVLSDADDRVL